jgi:hypothetical protein
MSIAPRIPTFKNTQLRDAADRMAVVLRDRTYCPKARDQVVRWAIAEGTPTGCPYLDHEDEDAATEAFIAGMEAVSLDSDAWDRDTSVLFDVAMLAEGNHPFPLPHEGDDDRDFDAAMAALEDLPLPISGGSPEAFEPSEADWADYHRWSEDLERRDGALYGYE